MVPSRQKPSSKVDANQASSSKAASSKVAQHVAIGAGVCLVLGMLALALGIVALVDPKDTTENVLVHSSPGAVIEVQKITVEGTTTVDQDLAYKSDLTVQTILTAATLTTAQLTVGGEAVTPTDINNFSRHDKFVKLASTQKMTLTFDGSGGQYVQSLPLDALDSSLITVAGTDTSLYSLKMGGSTAAGLLLLTEGMYAISLGISGSLSAGDTGIVDVYLSLVAYSEDMSNVLTVETVNDTVDYFIVAGNLNQLLSNKQALTAIGATKNLLPVYSWQAPQTFAFEQWDTSCVVSIPSMGNVRVGYQVFCFTRLSKQLQWNQTSFELTATKIA
jgi:hypothetical protein